MDNELFVALVRVAREDAQIRKTVLAILALPALQRKSLLGSVVRDMTLQGEPRDLIAAVEALRDSDVAEKVREVLGKDAG